MLGEYLLLGVSLNLFRGITLKVSRVILLDLSVVYINGGSGPKTLKWKTHIS